MPKFGILTVAVLIVFFAIMIGGFAVNPLYADSKLNSEHLTDSPHKSRPPDDNPEQSPQRVVVVDEIIDPNTDPNMALAEVAAFLHVTADKSPPASLHRPDKPWQIHYHPQVTPRVFDLLCYPYYPGGQDYTQPSLPALKSRLESFPLTESSYLDPNELTINDSPVEFAKLNDLRLALEKSSDLVTQWRTINESPFTALEMVYSIELTKTSTGIYQSDPILAVQVKRTIGQIGRRNRQFDLLSRLINQSLLAGIYDKALMARLDKQITELQSLLIRLTEQNDAISRTLGIGKISRPYTYDIAFDPINFSIRK